MHAYYRLPKLLFTNKIFRNMSSDAKILYGLMLDRMSISQKNKWIDSENRAFIIYSQQEAMEMLGCKENKAINLFKELEAIGLMERKKKGQGKAALLYLKDFVEEDSEEVQTREKPMSEQNDEVSDMGKTKVKTFEKPIYNLTVSEHKTTLMEDNDMPRVNLAITQELYDQIEKAAKKENVTVNYYICDMLEEKFGKRTVYDYTLAINNMIAEAKTMKAEFVLADLPTFAGVNDVLIEYEIKESPAQVRSRLGKMFTEAVKQGNAKGIERVVIERNGVEEFKSASRAAVYCNKLYKQKKNSK